MENTSSKRDQQLMFLYTVVAIIVVYYAVTFWLPNIYHFIRVQTEKSVALQSVKDQVSNDDFDTTELTSVKKATKESDSQAKRPINPAFKLDSGVLSQSSAKPQPDRASKRGPEPMVKQTVSPKFQFRVPASNVVSVPKSTKQVEPAHTDQQKQALHSGQPTDNTEQASSSRVYLGGFASDSIEARLHEANRIQRQPAALLSDEEMAQLMYERDLRAQQDAEYSQSLELDQEATRNQDLEQELLLNIEARRKELATLVHAEPEVDASNKDIVTLSFRFRNQTGDAKANTATRIKRRFSVTQHCAADVLNFIESLELRPIFTEFDLSLDYPTRVLNRSVQGTLQDMGITADSVVWIKFSDA